MVRRQPQILCRHVRQGEYRGGSPAYGRENTAHAHYARPDSQGGAQAQETGGTGEETLPQETCRQREAVRR